MITKKYRIKEIPKFIKDTKPTVKKQALIEVGAKEKIVENSNNEKYWYIKRILKGKNKREEKNEIVKEVFDCLCETIISQWLTKHTYRGQYENIDYEVEEYQDNLVGLNIINFAFKNDEDLKNFTPPNWINEDITELSDYRLKNLLFNPTKVINIIK